MLESVVPKFQITESHAKVAEKENDKETLLMTNHVENEERK